MFGIYRSTDTFDVFGYGEQVYRQHKFKHEIEDKLHFYLEECDNLQVKHIIFLTPVSSVNST